MLTALLLTLLQPPPDPVDPRIQIVPPQRDCAPGSSPDEIVVCGDRGEDSPYRIAPEFRDIPSGDDRHVSRSTRVWDQDVAAGYEDQVSGPFAYMRYSRAQDCQWRVARQELQGRRPDCRARIRPDSPTDWQRR